MKNERSRKKSNIFRVLRLCLGLSLTEMAERCGLSAVYLSELELGKKTNPSEQTLQKIADACGLRLDTLRYFTEVKTGDSLDYQTHLLHSLEYYAQSMQKTQSEDSSEHLEEIKKTKLIIEGSSTMSIGSIIKSHNNLKQVSNLV